MLPAVRLRVGAVCGCYLPGDAAGATRRRPPPCRSRQPAQPDEAPRPGRATWRASASAPARETFEGFQPWGVGKGTQNLTRTAVGSFKSFGARGRGNSVVGKGTKLQVRDDNHMKWGRYNTRRRGRASADGHWLDSNDNRGMKWRYQGRRQVQRHRLLRDRRRRRRRQVLDQGRRHALLATSPTARQLRNGNIHFVRILLPEAVNRLTVQLLHNIANDGFGVDGVVVGKAAPVPLPPAAALLVPACSARRPAPPGPLGPAGRFRRTAGPAGGLRPAHSSGVAVPRDGRGAVASAPGSASLSAARVPGPIPPHAAAPPLGSSPRSISWDPPGPSVWGTISGGSRSWGSSLRSPRSSPGSSPWGPPGAISLGPAGVIPWGRSPGSAPDPSPAGGAGEKSGRRA